MPYRFFASRFSPMSSGLFIVFLLSTARDAKATLEARAPQRAFHVKDSSFRDARETPAMIGSRTLSAPGLSFGALRIPVAQRRHTYGMPTKSETTVIVHGIGNAFWHFLFVML